jgi:hypothetical protein
MIMEMTDGKQGSIPYFLHFYRPTIYNVIHTGLQLMISRLSQPYPTDYASVIGRSACVDAVHSMRARMDFFGLLKIFFYFSKTNIF